MYDLTVTPVAIAGIHTTAGAAEETVPVSVDGGVPVTSIPVPAGKTFVPSDFHVGVGTVGQANFRLQKTTDGVTFTDLHLARAGPDDTNPSSLETPPKVVGGPLVAVRVRAETPAGADTVYVSVGAVTDP